MLIFGIVAEAQVIVVVVVLYVNSVYHEFLGTLLFFTVLQFQIHYINKMYLLTYRLIN